LRAVGWSSCLLVVALQSSVGGKMLVFQSTLPSTGLGALRNRDNPRLYGTDKEHTLLTAADT
jgi:protein transport protein SEC24